MTSDRNYDIIKEYVAKNNIKNISQIFTSCEEKYRYVTTSLISNQIYIANVVMMIC